MDSLAIQLDISNKKGNFVSTKALGAYTDIQLSVYNFVSAPDLSTLKASIYADSGAELTTCTAFTADTQISGRYLATLTLSTDNAIAYFSAKKPSYIDDFTLILSDDGDLYCNTKITVKNNPNGVPSSPTPVAQHFVLKTDEGFTIDQEGEDDVFTLTDSSNAGQVRRFLLTLTKVLKSKGVV